MMHIPTLSFCITCKNRLHQLQQTLEKNLKDNAGHQEFIEFILVDFNSKDNVRGWITDNFKNELNTGYLKFFSTGELLHWHASIAKNTAHLCASNDILVNLDCDNYTGVWGGAYVVKTFKKYGRNIVFHQFSGGKGDGSYGRIAVDKEHFKLIGGYDESFEPMGYQDDDLIKRLVKLGLNYFLQQNQQYNNAISNTKEEGIIGTNSCKNYTEMVTDNYLKSRHHLLDGRLIANGGLFGIRKNIFDDRGQPFFPKL